MRAPETPKSSIQNGAVSFGLVALVALVLKIVLAVTTYGTNDTATWAGFVWKIRESGGIGLYHEVSSFNHPPFMIHVLQLIDLVASKTEMPFPFWLRLPAIFADVGSTYLVWKILALAADTAASPLALMLMAAAPASIMISGFHGNTDAVMIFFVLLSIYLVDQMFPAWIAGATLGIGLGIKLVPLVFVPAILLYLPSSRKRTGFLVAAGVVFAVGSLPYILQDPVYIGKRIFGYQSIYGIWGLGNLLSALPSWLSLVNSAYYRLGRYVLIGVIVIVSVSMNRTQTKVPLFLQCGLVAFLFMSLTPGFSVQYLAWLVPWVVALGAGATLVYYLSSGLFLFVVYTFWSHGFPWYFANSWAVDAPWPGWILSLELLCWMSVVWITVVYVNILYRGSIRAAGATGSA